MMGTFSGRGLPAVPKEAQPIHTVPHSYLPALLCLMPFLLFFIVSVVFRWRPLAQFKNVLTCMRWYLVCCDREAKSEFSTVERELMLPMDLDVGVKKAYPEKFLEVLKEYKKYLIWQIDKIKEENLRSRELGSSLALDAGRILGPLRSVSTVSDDLTKQTTVTFEYKPTDVIRNQFGERAPVSLCEGEELLQVKEGFIRSMTSSHVKVSMHGRPMINSKQPHFLIPSTTGSISSLETLLEKVKKKEGVHGILPSRELIDYAFRRKLLPSVHHDPPLSSTQPLNASQLRAVCAALNDHRPFVCIQGPPGTGKTKVAVEILLQAQRKNKKVLVVASTHAALKELMDRFVMEEGKSGSDSICHATIETLGEQMKGHPRYLELREELLDADYCRRRRPRKYNSIFHGDHGMQNAENQSINSAENQSINSQQISKDDYSMGKARNEVKKIRKVRELSLVSWVPSFLLVDEAAQLTEPATWVAAAMAPRIVLTGDPKQLPGVILDYEMNEKIMEWSNEKFYDGRLKAHPFVAKHTLKEICAALPDSMGAPMLFYNTDERKGKEEMVNKSYRNKAEAKTIVRLIGELLKLGIVPHQMGVIAPYFAQTMLIRLLLKKKGFGEAITVDTVDAFQGQERDMIMFSAVRNNEEGRFGFVTEERRLNVAVTRARRQFAIFGSGKMLKKDPLFASLLQHCTEIDPLVLALEMAKSKKQGSDERRIEKASSKERKKNGAHG